MRPRMALHVRRRVTAERVLTHPHRLASHLLSIALLALLASACSGDHHVLAPEGSQAKGISAIGWFMIVTASVIGLVFYALLAYGLVRGGRRRGWGSESGFVIAGGIVLPALVVGILSVLTINTLNDGPADDAVHIEVVGHQFWWEVRYLDEGFTTANEFQIPVDRPVELTLRSDDVIHSFWVPDLAGKIDMVPGQTNHLQLEAHEPGRYRGQCAEYCGLQHAQMAFFVTASEPADYEAWVADHAADAPAPTGAEEQAGQQAFMDLPCASCHTIRGTDATGELGPDLTHFASRETIGAGAVDNTRGNLSGWIANSQTIKPGNEMPPIPMDPEQLTSLLAYLESLR